VQIAKGIIELSAILAKIWVVSPSCGFDRHTARDMPVLRAEMENHDGGGADALEPRLGNRLGKTR
jgi:hypothetical protein